MEVVVIWSARKHGVADEDIRHAVNNAIAVAPEARDLTMWIGPGRDGQLLEVGTVEASDFGGDIAVHAMPLRRKYFPLLPKVM